MTDETTPQDSAGSVDILTRLADHHAVTMWDVDEAAAEIARLRLAIRRLAEQDGTASACDGNVTVTMDTTLSGEEREAVEVAVEYVGSAYQVEHHAAVLRGLLERTK